MWATGKNSVGIPGKLLKAGTVTARGLSPVIMCPSTPAGGRLLSLCLWIRCPRPPLARRVT